jgi:PAT family beta-lactamase induction signal transducer AmpG
VAAVPTAHVGPANGLRVTAYRVGLVLGGGFLAGRAATLGWATTWRIAAGAFAAFALLTPRLPAAPAARRPTGPPWAPWAELAGRRGFVAFAALVFLFKVGDYAMARMTTPCLQDRGFSLAEVSDWVTPMEIVATIVGAWVGGWVTKRVGLFTALWTLGLFQAVSNLGYAAAADAGKAWLWAAAAFEPFCNGLGTAPFLSLLMVSCRKEHAGAQFALLTALMALSRTAVGAISGYGAERWGYSTYFAATFLLALPAFFLLPAARHWIADFGASRPQPRAPRAGPPPNGTRP